MPKIVNKKQDNSKYNRINQIYEILKNNTHGMTITELSKELDVSSKTIQRDLYEVLNEFGAIKEGRTWKINPKLTKDNLASNEKLILGILDEMAKGAGKVFYSKAHSLLSQVTQQLEHPIFANVNSEILEEKNMILFEQMEKAIKQKVEIIFVYEKYHLKIIQNIQIQENTFEIPEIIEERLRYANSVWFNLDEQFPVKLFLDKNIRKYFERKPLRGQSITGEDKDGSIQIEIKITNEMEIIPLIFWYIPYIKVLEPQWLADMVKERVENYVKEI